MLLLILADGLLFVLFSWNDEFSNFDHFLGALQPQSDCFGFGIGFAEVGGHFQLNSRSPGNDLLAIPVIIYMHEIFTGLSSFEKKFLGSVTPSVVG